MSLEQLMQHFAKELELEGSLNTEVPGVFSIPLEEDLSIMISQQPQGIALTASLAPCPQNEQEAFFTDLMLANLFGQGTRGAVLGLDEEGKRVVLSQMIDYEVNESRFVEILEDFINTADLWRDEAITHAAANKG